MGVEVARLLGFVFAFTFCVSAASAVTLSNSGGGSWAYYKEITVKENSGKTLTDYQVLVELNSANFDFSKAKSDGSDIRFSLNGEELNYWIEEWNPYAKKAKIWVKVPHIPANGEVKIKMCYGNPSASAVSNGDKVFVFFDNFEDGDYTDKWESFNKRYTVTPTIEEVNGYLRVTGPNAGVGNWYDIGVWSKSDFSTDSGYVLTFKGYSDDANHYDNVGLWDSNIVTTTGKVVESEQNVRIRTNRYTGGNQPVSKTNDILNSIVIGSFIRLSYRFVKL